MQASDKNFLFHASSLDVMNDSAEYAEARKLCPDPIDEIIMSYELGIPFALCFSEKDDSIPMWNMYAHEGKGVCLKFDFECINRYFDSFAEQEKYNNRYVKFSKCNYRKIRSRTPINNKTGNLQYPNIALLREKMTKAAFVKPNSFCHEGEWRLIAWRKWDKAVACDMLFKESKDELCPYIIVPIPISCLKEIVLRPNASYQLLEATRLLKYLYGENNEISVNISSLTLKV